MSSGTEATPALRSRSTPGGDARRTGPSASGINSTTATSAISGTTKSASSWQVVSTSSVVPMLTVALSRSVR